MPETLGLHIPVVRIAHGTSREPSGLLTLHVPYNGREYCRSQLEAHSFSYKPVPTTDEDGMRFHVVCLLLSTSGEVVLVYPYSEKSVKIFSPLQSDGFSPMDNNWLQELFRSFLRDIDFRRLMHMLIIFVLLLVVTPESLKQSIGAHNPEFLPEFSLYYLLVVCISFFLSSVTSFTTQSAMQFLIGQARNLKVALLSAQEKDCLSYIIETGQHVVYILKITNQSLSYWFIKIFFSEPMTSIVVMVRTAT
ncbi:super-infection exclusion protein B [Klebsiella pneumoniae]